MIRVLIVEDEDLAARRLIEMLSRTSEEIDIIGRTSSVKETHEFLLEQTPDLMFLDINLSDGYSFSIFDKEGFDTPPIIFTTAYSEFAIKAFELNSISYLLKPVTQEHLSLALKKYKHLKELASTEDNLQKYQKLFKDILNPYRERFLIKLNHKLETVKVEDISYFFSEDKVTFIMLSTGKTLPIEQSLKTLERELDPTNFYRINRKYLLHISSISKMYYTSKSKIKVELTPANSNDSDLIFVAIEKVGQFKKWLAK